jgi:Methyltransferase domain
VAELLLHSLAEFREVILPCLELTEARTVVEVGGEDGTFTRVLAGWAQEQGGKVWCIDPAPSPDLVALDDAEPAITLVRERSLDALAHLEPADAYLIDGDHNHYTVLRELEAITAAAVGDGPLVVLHDVGWPWGERDLYYAPEDLPAGAVHPHTYDHGVTLGSAGVVPGGFRSEGRFAAALEAGGPANGVRTAVDDFLQTHEELRLAVVPCIFGLGVLYPASAPWAERVSRFLEPYDGNPLLDRLEQNRLALYLKVLELQDDLKDVRRHVEDLTLRVRDVEVENRALWARVGELEAREEKARRVREEVATLSRSRALAVAEAVSRVWWRSTDAGGGVSREHLRALLAETDG